MLIQEIVCKISDFHTNALISNSNSTFIALNLYLLKDVTAGAKVQ